MPAIGVTVHATQRLQRVLGGALARARASTESSRPIIDATSSNCRACSSWLPCSISPSRLSCAVVATAACRRSSRSSSIAVVTAERSEKTNGTFCCSDLAAASRRATSLSTADWNSR